MTITPEILRSIADTLVSHPRELDGERYICVSASDFGCNKTDVHDLLREGGLEDLTGTLSYAFQDGTACPGYNECAMPVRFMYLEFLAHYLESEA